MKVVRFITIVLLAVSFVFAGSFDSYKVIENNSFNNLQEEFVNYKQKNNLNFHNYMEAYQIAFKDYKKNILKYWDKTEVSTKYKWVQYDKTYSAKKVVDFNQIIIKLQVISDDEFEAKQKLKNLFQELLKDDIQSAYDNDQLEKKVLKQLKNKKSFEIKNNQPIIKDIIDEYKDAEELYREYYNTVWKKVAFMQNSQNMDHYITSMFGGTI